MWRVNRQSMMALRLDSMGIGLMLCFLCATAQARAQLPQTEVRKLQNAAVRALRVTDREEILCIGIAGADADSSFLAELGPARLYRPWSACSLGGPARASTKVGRSPATLVMLYAPVLRQGTPEVLLATSRQGVGNSGFFYCNTRKENNRWTPLACRKIYDLPP
jgi:hypothetical protein